MGHSVPFQSGYHAAYRIAVPGCKLNLCQPWDRQLSAIGLGRRSAHVPSAGRRADAASIHPEGGEDWIVAGDAPRNSNIQRCIHYNASKLWPLLFIFRSPKCCVRYPPLFELSRTFDVPVLGDPVKSDSALALGEARRGFRGRVVGIQAGDGVPGLSAQELECRLIELGFVEGAAVEILHEGAFGRDPIAVRLDNARVALRRREARAILVAALDIAP
jgi:ferrous iron transport protein A